jgi:HAE1 family hydrophobic/amphiphilic exporter-1
MNLSAIFIKRPVTTTLIMLGILVFGLMAYRQLPVSDLPVVDFPTIQVQANLPGANPETMATAVALPLEKQFSAIAGLTSINSVSSQGQTQITLQFDLNRNIDAAAQDVQAMIARTTRALPANMPAPPSLQKNNPTDQSVMFLALQSRTLPLSMVDEYAQTLAQRISVVNGVSQVNINGSQKAAVRVEVDPHKLATRDRPRRGRHRDHQCERQPADRHDAATRNFVVKANASCFRPRHTGRSSSRIGMAIRAPQRGRARLRRRRERQDRRLVQGRAAITLAINKQPGTNVVQVVDGVKALLPALAAQLPAAMTLETRGDRSVMIRESVQT